MLTKFPLVDQNILILPQQNYSEIKANIFLVKISSFVYNYCLTDYEYWTSYKYSSNDLIFKSSTSNVKQ